jgi:flagellar biosynthesis/type III secretory pathway protein FliH
LDLGKRDQTEQGLQRGLQQGRQEGVLIGRIELLQQLLRQTPLARPDLEALGLDELQRLEEELTRQLTPP